MVSAVDDQGPVDTAGVLLRDPKDTNGETQARESALGVQNLANYGGKAPVRCNVKQKEQSSHRNPHSIET